MDGSGPRGGYASIAFPQRFRRLFSPAAKWRHSSRKAKKPSATVLCCAAGPDGCGPIAPRAKDRHRGCDGRGPTTERKTTMATIGTFTAADNGYGGSVKTLTLNFRAKFVPTEKDNDKAPDCRIIAGNIECGAAWNKTARDSDREYLSVKLDDPSFPAPIYASLVRGEGDDSFSLIWSRRNGD